MERYLRIRGSLRGALLSSIGSYTRRLRSTGLCWMTLLSLEFLRKMPLGWTDPLMRMKFLVWFMISMVIKRQVWMVVQWLFFNPIRAW